MFIVGFNGPPESGKDTLADMLANKLDAQGASLPVRMESLSLPLRKIAYAMVNWHGISDPETYAKFKLTHFRNLNRTGRQLMIDVSESFLKPTYGIEIMADLLLERNIGFPGILLVRDCGFQIEINPLVKMVGPDNFYLVQVAREGKTFANDSRETVWHPWAGKRQHRVDNSGTLEDLQVEAGRLYSRLVNQCGWKL